MDDFHRHLQKELQNPEFRRLWEDDAPYRAMMKAMVVAQNEFDATQAQLAERCGMSQSNLNRIIMRNGNPTLATLQKIARGFGKVLTISFVDPSEVERMDLSDASRTA